MATSAQYLCPECGRTVVKAGRVVINRSGRTKQQWKCSCGRRTLKPLRGKGGLNVLLRMGTNVSA